MQWFRNTKTAVKIGGGFTVVAVAVARLAKELRAGGNGGPDGRDGYFARY